MDSSASTTKSMMSGDASSESSHVLCMLNAKISHTSSKNVKSKPDCLMSIHKNLAHVLIQSTLRISNSRHVPETHVTTKTKTKQNHSLDDDQMIGMFSWSIQNVVACNHVVHNVRLGDFLRSELSRSRQIVTRTKIDKKKKDELLSAFSSLTRRCFPNDCTRQC